MTYEPVIHGPLQLGDEAKRNQATFWQPICREAVGTYAENYYFWQIRRPIKEPVDSIIARQPSHP